MHRYFLWPGLIACILAVCCTNCRIPYNPPVRSTGTGYLVVEGYIDGAAPTTIRLSRTRSVSDTALPVIVVNAQVSIEDDHQDSYRLSNGGNGDYTIGQVSLNPAYRYRLHIFTPDGKEYLSDFVRMRQSPPIDSLSWKFKDDGVQVYANTHDPRNLTRYYRWEYSETWEFRTTYYSILKYENGAVIPRLEQINDCWRSDASSNILLGSSAKLSSDVISLAPLAYVPPHDQKISVLYSILVKQYALDTSGYNYWLALKNNTENIGSIFDPQPSGITGNIHCVNDASEIVVGYIGAGNTTRSRMFISNNAMPYTWNPYMQCNEIVVPIIPDSIKFYFEGGYTPIDTNLLKGGYNASTTFCVDCTVQGTNKKPDFWP